MQERKKNVSIAGTQEILAILVLYFCINWCENSYLISYENFYVKCVKIMIDYCIVPDTSAFAYTHMYVCIQTYVFTHMENG